MTSQCGEPAAPSHKGSTIWKNEVVLNGAFLNGAKWVTDKGDDACVITRGYYAKDNVSYRQKYNYDKPGDSDGIVLNLDAARHESGDVATWFNDKLQGPITPGITGLPWKACNKYTSDYPKTLNFGFCGEFHTQYGTNYNACFAQGDKSNWYMGSKDLTMKCHGGSSNTFDVQPNF